MEFKKLNPNNNNEINQDSFEAILSKKKPKFEKSSVLARIDWAFNVWAFISNGNDKRFDF